MPEPSASHRSWSEYERTLDALIRTSSEVRFRVNADWSSLHQLAGGDFITDTEAENRDWLDSYIPPDDRDAVRAEIARAIRTKSTYLIEHRVNRVDGTVGWAFARAVPLLDEAGNITEWLGTASDITGHKRAETDLLERETRLRLAIEAGQIGEWELDVTTNASVRALRHDQIFGHAEPVEEWGLETFLSYVLPEDRARTEAAFKQAAETGAGWNFQCRIRRWDDNAVRWIAAYSAPQLDETGRVIKLFGMVQDITDQKTSEIGLRELNDTLERQVAERTQERNQIWQVSRDMLLVSDLTGVWLSVNPAWTRVLGWTEAELVGRTSEWLEHPDDQARTRAEITKLAEGATTLAFENRFRTREGDYRTLSWTAVPEGDHCYCVARDVTEERARAALLAEHAAELEQIQARAMLFFNMSPDYKMLLRMNGNGQFTIEDINPALEQLVGRPRSFAQGSAPSAILPPASASNVEESAKRCLATVNRSPIR